MKVTKAVFQELLDELNEIAADAAEKKAKLRAEQESDPDYDPEDPSYPDPGEDPFGVRLCYDKVSDNFEFATAEKFRGDGDMAVDEYYDRAYDAWTDLLGMNEDSLRNAIYEISVKLQVREEREVVAHDQE
jgi:hypothetical protein